MPALGDIQGTLTLDEDPSVEAYRSTEPIGVSGARVVICEPRRTASTDAGGSFRLPGLAPGRYVLRFCYRGAQLGERTVEVRSGSAAVALLELAPDAFHRAVADDIPCCAVERSPRLRTATRPAR